MDNKEHLEKIEAALRRIENAIETSLVPECRRMGNHISFVEKVYERVYEWALSTLSVLVPLLPGPARAHPIIPVEDVD